jgi:N-acetylneuraminic acid mutarotase
MALARVDPHAVVLGDGRVLVVSSGRESGSVSVGIPAAEVWDPETNAWQTTRGLNAPRGDFVAVPLADGRALVTGGYNDRDQSYSSTYVYDPRAGRESWSKVGLLGTARTAPAAAVLPDGRVLVAGGYYRTEPDYGRNATPGIVFAAYPSATFAVAVSSGPRLADMGPPDVGPALATAELFDPATGTWSTTGSLHYARVGASAVTLTDGRILVVGSIRWHATNTAEIYDPKTGRFNLVGRLPDIDLEALADLGVPLQAQDPEPEVNGTLVALDDGGAVLIGHAGSWKHYADITRSFRFDPATARWSEIGQAFVAVASPDSDSGGWAATPGVLRSNAMVAKLPDGRVLVAGGDGGYRYAGGSGPSPDPVSVTATAELYDPATDTWAPLHPMPEARAGGAAVALADGSVLLVGGYNEVVWEQGYEQIVVESAVRFVPAP